MSWPKLKIGDITHVVTKGTTPTKDQGFVNNGVNFIKAEALNGDSALNPKGIFHISEDVHQKLKRSILQEYDVLLTIAGAKIGKCGIVRPLHLPANTNQAVGIMRVDRSKADPRYLYFWFKQRHTFAFVQGLNAQAAQPNINLSMLKSIEIPIPPLSVQARIASIFSAYDNVIKNNRRRIQLLEQAARLLYREWFVRLRFPGHEHVKIIDGVPEGWEKKKIADVTDTYGGGTPSTKVSEYWVGGNITWFIPTDLTNNDCLVLLDSEKKITEEGLKKSSAKMLPPEAILMTSRASIGYFGLYDGAACTNQGFISIVSKKDFLKLYLLHNLMGRKEEILLRAGGTTYKEINKTTFRNMSLVIPPDHLLKQFDSFAYDVVKQVRILKKQDAALKQARDLLLPRLMNGEIKV